MKNNVKLQMIELMSYSKYLRLKFFFMAATVHYGLGSAQTSH